MLLKLEQKLDFAERKSTPKHLPENNVTPRYLALCTLCKLIVIYNWLTYSHIGLYRVPKRKIGLQLFLALNDKPMQLH